MTYSMHDRFFGIEFVLGSDMGSITKVVDDGGATEDHAVAVDPSGLTDDEMAAVLRHEFEHAVQRMLQRRRARTNPTG